ncbi:MAG: EamA family transporter, partial [Oscillospiraceae bacterium]|nr:EamA family transporter [Oscillospiraceae bacterium]
MNKKKGFVVLTIAAVCWGLGYVFQSIGLRYLSPLAMVCTRYVVATIALI